MSEDFRKTINNDDSDKKEIEVEKQKEKISKPVVIRADAYKTIILYASRYANKSIPPEEWKEIYGILIGKTDRDLVYIEHAEALTFGHATDVQLDEDITDLSKKYKKGLIKKERTISLLDGSIVIQV